MATFHSEPYIYLAGLRHDAALIAWGAFYFRTSTGGPDDDMKLVVTISGKTMTVTPVGEKDGLPVVLERVKDGDLRSDVAGVSSLTLPEDVASPAAEETIL